MDFHEAISMDNSEPNKLLKTFIFSTVVVLYILRIFLSLNGYRFALPSEEENMLPHVSLTYRLAALYSATTDC